MKGSLHADNSHISEESTLKTSFWFRQSNSCPASKVVLTNERLGSSWGPAVALPYGYVYYRSVTSDARISKYWYKYCTKWYYYDNVKKRRSFIRHSNVLAGRLTETLKRLLSVPRRDRISWGKEVKQKAFLLCSLKKIGEDQSFDIMEGSNTEQISGGDAQKKAKKEKPANLVIPPKKPKLSKAERRALQEQQRAAKAQRQAQPADKSSGKNKGKQQNTASPVSNKSQEQNKSSAAPTQKSEVLAVNADGTKDPKQISVLAHLPPFRGKILFPPDVLNKARY